MGSVIEYVECPNCGSPDCFSDFYYKTGEEYVNCGECGYHYSLVIKNRNKPLKDLEEGDWEVKELKNPWGSYRVKSRGCIGHVAGALENKQQFDILKQNILDDINSVEEFFLSQFVNGKIIKTLIVENYKILNEIVDGH